MGRDVGWGEALGETWGETHLTLCRSLGDGRLRRAPRRSLACKQLAGVPGTRQKHTLAYSKPQGHGLLTDLPPNVSVLTAGEYRACPGDVPPRRAEFRPGLARLRL